MIGGIVLEAASVSSFDRNCISKTNAMNWLIAVCCLVIIEGFEIVLLSGGKGEPIATGSLAAMALLLYIGIHFARDQSMCISCYNKTDKENQNENN